jgi:hypothetical protein
MPRVIVPVTQFSKAGIAPAAEVTGDPTNLHYLFNDSQTVILVRNNGASTRTFTAQFAVTFDGQSVTGKPYSIPATSSRYIGPFETGTYGTTMNVDVDHADLRLSAYTMAR